MIEFLMFAATAAIIAFLAVAIVLFSLGYMTKWMDNRREAFGFGATKDDVARIEDKLEQIHATLTANDQKAELEPGPSRPY